MDNLNTLKVKTKTRAKWHDENVKPIKYEYNDLVLVKNDYLSSCIKNEIKKFFLLYRGPYKVIKLENAYVLGDLQTNEIVGTHNVAEFKRFYPSFIG